MMIEITDQSPCLCPYIFPRKFLLHSLHMARYFKEKTPSASCLLDMGYSTIAVGWLRKSNVKEQSEDNTEPACKLEAARHLARIIQQVQSMIYTKWFPGCNNIVLDYLSRNFHLSPSCLTNLLAYAVVPH